MKPDRIKAIVLTCDRYRAITEHMIAQYDRLWPHHPFQFRIPYQQLGGTDSAQREYVETAPEIRATVLQLLDDIADDEWIYWCVDDKYPIELRLGEIERAMTDRDRIAGADGMLFCRCRVLLSDPKRALLRGEITGPSGTVYVERKAWFQIWIHQLLRAKVLRYLFAQLPEQIPSAKAMDALKHQIAKPHEFRLFVTKQNLAVFGESTHHGRITQNCYESATAARIALPEWFQQPSSERITMGKL